MWAVGLVLSSVFKRRHFKLCEITVEGCDVLCHSLLPYWLVISIRLRPLIYCVKYFVVVSLVVWVLLSLRFWGATIMRCSFLGAMLDWIFSSSLLIWDFLLSVPLSRVVSAHIGSDELPQ